ncbi:unnamed protein product [Thlaspi arvense]|uniref:Prolamin-like domain-containing protein n=1 Tax=Thlaspi arvense TaxID=13288 RepID=A0AAU9SEP3_THLAR|nr:unnamed protein product [Thlaspi arvense]
MMKSVILIVALLCLVSLPHPTIGLQKKPWPKPSDLANHNGNLGDSKVGPFESVLVSQPGELEKCLNGGKSKVAEKCFSQVFSSWAENDFALDKECCEIVLNMDKKCNGHLHMMFKSHFFTPLLQYSCHIKHA